MRIDIMTLFPGLVDTVLSESIAEGLSKAAAEPEEPEEPPNE